MEKPLGRMNEVIITSACEIFHCETCKHLLRGRCPGCIKGNEIQQADSKEPCAIYQCVVSKKLNSCKDCSSAVCPIPRSLEIVCPIRNHFEKKRCYSRKLSDYFQRRQEQYAGKSTGIKVSPKVITRLHWYLYALNEFLAHGIMRVSSEDIFHKVGIKDYLIRHDLSQFGEFGRPSIGYDVEFLRSSLAKILHLDEPKNVVWVGADRLAKDPLTAKSFQDHGFIIVDVFDTNPSKVSSKINGLTVKLLSDSVDSIRNLKVESAIIAVAQDEAQTVADMLVGAGVQGILNLTSAVVVAPRGVRVRNVDVVAELFALCHFYQ